MEECILIGYGMIFLYISSCTGRQITDHRSLAGDSQPELIRSDLDFLKTLLAPDAVSHCFVQDPVRGPKLTTDSSTLSRVLAKTERNPSLVPALNFFGTAQAYMNHLDR